MERRCPLHNARTIDDPTSVDGSGVRCVAGHEVTYWHVVNNGRVIGTGGTRPTIDHPDEEGGGSLIMGTHEAEAIERRITPQRYWRRCQTPGCDEGQYSLGLCVRCWGRQYRSQHPKRRNKLRGAERKVRA